MISLAAARLITLESEPLCRVAPGERSAERINQSPSFATSGVEAAIPAEREAYNRNTVSAGCAVARSLVVAGADHALNVGVHQQLRDRLGNATLAAAIAGFGRQFG